MDVLAACAAMVGGQGPSSKRQDLEGAVPSPDRLLMLLLKNETNASRFRGCWLPCQTLGTD